MSQTIQLVLDAEVAPENIPAFEALTEELVRSASGEPGTLIYEWFSDQERTSWRILERYRSQDEMDAHVSVFVEHFAGRFFGLCRSVKFWVYGEVSDRSREILATVDATAFERRAGFNRL